MRQRTLFSTCFLVVSLICSILFGGCSNANSSVPPTQGITSFVTPTITFPTSPPTTPGGNLLFPQGAVSCTKAFHNPAELDHPRNKTECQTSGGLLLTLAEGDGFTAELDLKDLQTVGLSNYELRITIDLSSAGETYAGLLLGTDDQCHCGVVIAMNVMGDWRSFNASELDTAAIDTLTSFSGAKEVSTTKLDLVLVRHDLPSEKYFALYSNGRFVVGGSAPPTGMFGFMALAPSGTQSSSHVVEFKNIEVWG